MYKKIAFIFLIFFLFLGFSAIFKEPADCVASDKNPNPDHPVICYYDVAYNYALKGDNKTAIEWCMKIKTSDDSEIAHQQTNLCLRDIAEISKDYTVCDKIDNKYIRNTCIAEIEAKIELEEKAKKCGISFIFPAVLFLTFFFRFKIH